MKNREDLPPQASVSEQRRSRSVESEALPTSSPSESFIGESQFTSADSPVHPGSGLGTEPRPVDVSELVEHAATKIRNLRGRSRNKSRRLVKPPEGASSDTRRTFSPEQRLMLFDTWFRSGLPAKDFGSLIGISHHTLYNWKKRFESDGPAGLMDQPKGARKGSRLSEITKRSILMLKEAHPEYGCQRISDELARGPALGASASAVSRVLHESGYQLEETPTKRHRDKPRRFERAKPNQLWQTDLFTFMLKRQNRRVHLVAFMDDHSRFITGYGLHSTSSAAMVIETFRGAISSYHAPEEVLTDNGSQYITWRGKSAFAKECDKHGIHQIVATPRRPQTLGKIERFWGTLWRSLIETSIFLDLEDARRRIGLFIDHYNFQRPHRGIEGLVPGDRFFRASEEVLSSMKARISANAHHLAVNGIPAKSVYLTGQVDGKPLSLHRQGDKVVLLEDGRRQDVELVIPEIDPPKDSSVAQDTDGVSTSPDIPMIIDDRGSHEPRVGVSALDEGILKVSSSIDSVQSNKEATDDNT